MKPGKARELIKEISDKLIAAINVIIVYLSAGEGRKNFIVIWGTISAYMKVNAVLCLLLTFSLKQAELHLSSLKYFLLWGLSPNSFCPFCNCSHLDTCEALLGNSGEKGLVAYIHLFNN